MLKQLTTVFVKGAFHTIGLHVVRSEEYKEQPISNVTTITSLMRKATEWL
jgi:hypothetical protein